MHLISDQQIELLHRKYAPNDEVYDLVFTHCKSQLLNVDVDLVRAGALLHDIGVYAVLDTHGRTLPGVNYIAHGIRGEEILHNEGFPEILWRFGSHHTGVGLTKDDIQDQNLPLPLADFTADTVEEQIVMYADKFHSKTQPPYFNSYEWYKDHVSQFGLAKASLFESMAKRFGEPNLQILAQKYDYKIR